MLGAPKEAPQKEEAFFNSFPVSVPGLWFASHTGSLLGGLFSILAGLVALGFALTSGISTSWQIAGTAYSSVCLLGLTASAFALRKTGAVDTVAVLMLLVASYLVTGAGWYSLATEGSTLSAFAASSPLLAVGCVMVCFFGVARKILPLLGVYQAVFHGGLTSDDRFSLLGGNVKGCGFARSVTKGDEVILVAGNIAPADIVISSGCVTVEELKLSGVPITKVLDEGEVLFGGSRILGGEAKGIALGHTPEACLAVLESLVAKRLSLAAHREREEESTARRSTLLALIFCSVAAAISFSERSPDPAASLLAGGGVLLCSLFAVLRDALLIARLQFLAAWSRRGVVVPTFNVLDSLARCREVAFEFPLVAKYSVPVATEFAVLDDRIGAKELASNLLSIVGRSEGEIFRSVTQLLHKVANDYTPQRVLDMQESSERGITGLVHGVAFSIGTEDFLVESGIHFQPEDSRDSVDQGIPNLYVAVGGEVVAMFRLSEGPLASIAKDRSPTSWPATIAARVYTGVVQNTLVPHLVVRSAIPTAIPAAIPTGEPNVSLNPNTSTVKDAPRLELPSAPLSLEALPMPNAAISVHRTGITLIGATPDQFGVLIPAARNHLNRVERLSQALQVVCILGVISVFLGLLVPVWAALAFPIVLALAREIPDTSAI